MNFMFTDISSDLKWFSINYKRHQTVLGTRITAQFALLAFTSGELRNVWKRI